MATDEDMQASLDGGTAGSLIFTARLTGRKAPRGCYGNRLIICREGLSAATASQWPSCQFPLSSRKLDWLWWGLDLGQMANIGFLFEAFEEKRRLMFCHQCPCVCVHVHFLFLLDQQNPGGGGKWHNMPAINQTKLSTCGLTLSSQLLKYVVSNYWNMYATSVPRNTFSPAFSHPGSNQEHYSASRFKGLTVQSHQTVRGIGTMSGDQRHLSLALISPPSAWKWWKYEIWICLGCESSTGALSVCWAGPLIDRSLPLGKRSMAGLQPESKYAELLEVGAKQLLHHSSKE